MWTVLKRLRCGRDWPYWRETLSKKRCANGSGSRVRCIHGDTYTPSITVRRRLPHLRWTFKVNFFRQSSFAGFPTIGRRFVLNARSRICTADERWRTFAWGISRSWKLFLTSNVAERQYVLRVYSLERRVSRSLSKIDGNSVRTLLKCSLDSKLFGGSNQCEVPRQMLFVKQAALTLKYILDKKL